MIFSCLKTLTAAKVSIAWWFGSLSIFHQFYFENKIVQANFNAFCKTLLMIYGLCYWYNLFQPQSSQLVLGDVITVEDSLSLCL